MSGYFSPLASFSLLLVPSLRVQLSAAPRRTDSLAWFSILLQLAFLVFPFPLVGHWHVEGFHILALVALSTIFLTSGRL